MGDSVVSVLLSNRGELHDDDVIVSILHFSSSQFQFQPHCYSNLTTLLFALLCFIQSASLLLSIDTSGNSHCNEKPKLEKRTQVTRRALHQVHLVLIQRKRLNYPSQPREAARATRKEAVPPRREGRRDPSPGTPLIRKQKKTECLSPTNCTSSRTDSG